MGLNGIDNGAIRFTHVRVPRINLLDRFASVDRSGRYSSALTSEVCASPSHQHSRPLSPARGQRHLCVNDASGVTYIMPTPFMLAKRTLALLLLNLNT